MMAVLIVMMANSQQVLKQMCFLQKQKQSLELTLIIIKNNNRIAFFNGEIILPI